jgi:dTDP-4-dehydrorhamnose 3,5-epimerase
LIFTETALKGAYILELEPREDERGFFARTWCRREFEARSISFSVVQCNLSYNKRKGTLRGMHFQVPPYEEAKLVFCTRGTIYDVIIDLRKTSTTFARHVAFTLTAQNRRMLYVPKGFAHGFQTLEDETEVFYLMSEFHAPGSGRGVRWNDPAFGIKWPADQRIISEQDQNYPDFSESIL